jgi:hypothetical protein
MSTFWSSPTFDPKRQYRALLYIPGIAPFMLKSFSKPGVMDMNKTLEATRAGATLETRWVETQGRQWKPLKLVFVEDGARAGTKDDISFFFWNYLAIAGKMGSSVQLDTDERTGLQQLGNSISENLEMSARRKEFLASLLGKKIYIHELNAQGHLSNSWGIVNPIINSVDFGEIDYSSEELSTVTVNLFYDTFTYEYGSLEALGEWAEDVVAAAETAVAGAVAVGGVIGTGLSTLGGTLAKGIQHTIDQLE